HFAVDAVGIEHLLRRTSVRARKRLGIVRFKELQERAGQPGFLEHPEATVCARVVLPLLAQSLVEPFAIGRSDQSPLDRQGAGHRRRRQSTASGNDSSVFLMNAMNLSASAPSTMRWSNESERYAHVRIAMVSSPSGLVMTLGRFSIAP